MAASRKQKRKVGKVMGEYKHGSLKSGGSRKVKSRKQAIAIAMSESGQSRNRRKTRKTSGTAARKRKAPARKKTAARARKKKAS